MKFLNDKIKNFITWCKKQFETDGEAMIPSLRWFYLYSKENAIEPLTREEEEYLKVYCQEQILKFIRLKELAPDVGKFMLQNDYNWNEKQKIEIDKLFEGIKFVGLK